MLLPFFFVENTNDETMPIFSKDKRGEENCHMLLLNKEFICIWAEKVVSRIRLEVTFTK